MSRQTLHTSTNSSSRTSHKGGDGFHIDLGRQPENFQSFKLVNDPAISNAGRSTYRYDGVIPGSKMSVEVVDPRLRMARHALRRNTILLPIPEFQVDKNYVLPIRPKEVSFSNLNNNVNVKFLEEMCKGYGTIQDAAIFYHPVTQKHLGLAKVIFTTSTAAQKCSEKLNNTSSMGNIINVFLDDKGMDREKLHKELTKDPKQAEFLPPTPNSYLPRDVMGLYFASNASGSSSAALQTQSEKPQASLTSPPPLNPSCNHAPSYLSSRSYSTDQQPLNANDNAPANIHVLLRSSSSNARISVSDGTFNDLSRPTNSDLTGRNDKTLGASEGILASQIVQHQQHSKRDPRPHLKSGGGVPMDPADSRFDRGSEKPNLLDKNSRDFREKPNFNKREIKNLEKNRGWNYESDPKDRHSWNHRDNSKGDGWKDKYTSPYLKVKNDRNREKKDFYDNTYNRTSWSRSHKDHDAVISPKFQKLPDGVAESVKGQSGYLDFEKCRKKADDAFERNGQLDSMLPNCLYVEPPFQKKVISGLSESFSDILANSDDNAVDSSHLFVQSRISEPIEAEEDKHESLESRIQALLGQNLSFTSPLSGPTTAPVPVTLFQKTSPHPPLPPLPSQNNYESVPPPPLPPPLDVIPPPIDVVPPLPLFNYPPPSFTMPNQTISLAPVVPPNLSYPPPSQNLSIYPLPVGKVPTQSLDPNHPGILIPWGIPPNSASVPTVSVTIPPPLLPMEMVDLEKVRLQNLAISQKEEERAKFRKVENELVYQLKKVLSIDVTKKRIEVMAFKEFEEWWENKVSEHNEKILSSKPRLKPISSVSGSELKNGEQKAVSSLPDNQPSLFNSSEAARSSMTTTMTTLSGLFDESGSFAGGLLGLRNSRLTSMPSFRKKTEPVKKESEKELNKNVRDENDYEDDDDDDDDLPKSKLQFKGPRTPEGSDNEEPFSDRDSDSDSIITTPSTHNRDNYHNKPYKPPSPPPSPTTSNREVVKNIRVKKTKKHVRIPNDKITKVERAIYSSSSSTSSESEFSRGGDEEDESEDLFDVDVMSLVKKSSEPVRKLTVYTSDEDDDDDRNKTAAKPSNFVVRRTSYNSSSPSVSESDSDSEMRVNVSVEEKLPSKKILKSLQTNKKYQESKTVVKKAKKDGAVKRKRSDGKPRGRPASKKPRIRTKSMKDDDVHIYMKGSAGAKSKRSTNGMMNNDEAGGNEIHISEGLKTTGVGDNAAYLNNRVQLPSSSPGYEEPQPTCGYLHLLSDVASGVKQAEVNSVDSTSLEKRGNIGDAGFDDFFNRPSDVTATQADYKQDTVSIKTPSKESDDQKNNGTSLSTVVTAGLQSQGGNKEIVDELRDHDYSLNPWTEVKSRKGRKPKNKHPVVQSQDYVSEGEETVSAWSDNEDACLPGYHSYLRTRQHLVEHNYCGGFSEDNSEESDSEINMGSDTYDKGQILIEEFDSEGRNPKLKLELVPFIGENVIIQLEKNEQEKKINVVDDEDDEEEEEEGEYHSSDDNRMVIDEGPEMKKTNAKKRMRSSSEFDIAEPSSKKIKSERKSYNVKGDNRLPRELISLFPSSYTPLEPKTVQFSKRDFKEESHILYYFITRGLDAEDANFIKLKYEWLLKREQEENMRQMQWLLQTKWVPHPVMTESELSPSKKGRKSSKREYPQYHKSGSARTEGYYKISHQAKQYLKHAHVVDEQNQSSQLKSDETVLLPSSSSSSLLPSETSVDAMVRKRAQQNREARTEGRRWQNMLTTNLGEDIAEMLKFNQLQLRKKQLKFARSRIHDWGLFAMEPIAEGELVIEYVGQVIRQSVADLREKRYEADGIGSSYLFRIDHSTIVDATKFGNLSRFINHCCNPNCYAKIVSLDGVKRIVIYSRRDIEVNEEITYDYKFPIEDDKIPCFCGASGCRGTLN